jgi:hypothetical protein
MKRFWKNLAASASDIAWALVLTSITILFLTSTCTAKAQEDALPSVEGECAPAVLVNRRAVLEHEGDAGIWFHRDVVLCMVERLRVLPLYVDRVRLLEQRLSLSDERHALMVRQVELAEAGEQAAVGALETAVGLQRRAESWAARERTLRWLWAGIGVVLTAAAVAFSVWVYNKTEDPSGG